MRPWHALDEEAQVALRQDFERETAALPPTCRIEEKIARFRHWLAGRGIDYPA